MELKEFQVASVENVENFVPPCECEGMDNPRNEKVENKIQTRPHHLIRVFPCVSNDNGDIKAQSTRIWNNDSYQVEIPHTLHRIQILDKKLFSPLLLSFFSNIFFLIF